MKKRRLLVIWLVVIVVLAAFGAWRWRASSRKNSLPQIDTSRVERGRIVAKVTATGTLSALVTVQVGSQVSGTISALYADYNSRVTKGQLIAKIDPRLFQASVEQGRANYLAAQGNLAKAQAQAADAERQYQRNRTLSERQLIAQADLDTSQSNAEVARAQVEAARGAVEQTRAALSQTQVNLAYTSIISPINGVVISRSVDVGQTVAASFQAPVIFTIAEDLKKMQVDTSVAEADVGRLRDGMTATFTVDAYPSEAFRGTVRQIRNSPQTIQNVVTYDAVIDVDNSELKLRPGMTANCTFIYAEKDDVLRIPNAALRFRPPPEMAAFSASDRTNGHAGRPGGGAGAATSGGAIVRPRSAADTPDRRTIWIMRGEKPVSVRIRTGISDGTTTELVEGDLNAGDTVITDAAAQPSGFAAGLRRGGL
jgi:HlyD family secretion protein